jgi:hypothetical protein
MAIDTYILQICNLHTDIRFLELHEGRLDD